MLCLALLIVSGVVPLAVVASFDSCAALRQRMKAMGNHTVAGDSASYAYEGIDVDAGMGLGGLAGRRLQGLMPSSFAPMATGPKAQPAASTASALTSGFSAQNCSAVLLALEGDAAARQRVIGDPKLADALLHAETGNVSTKVHGATITSIDDMQNFPAI